MWCASTASVAEMAGGSLSSLEPQTRSTVQVQLNAHTGTRTTRVDGIRICRINQPRHISLSSHHYINSTHHSTHFPQPATTREDNFSISLIFPPSVVVNPHSSLSSSTVYHSAMPSPASPSDTASAASPATLVSSAPITPPTRSYAPLADLRDDSHSESDDDDSDDDGFEAAHAAFLARRIAEAAAESSAAAGGMSPFDESVIDHEWDELVKSMKAIVPSQHLSHTLQTAHAAYWSSGCSLLPPLLCRLVCYTVLHVRVCVLCVGCVLRWLVGWWTPCSGRSLRRQQFGSHCVCHGVHVAGLQVPQSGAR